MEEHKNKKIIRIILLVVMGLMTAFTLVMWFLNYQTMEQAVTTVEKASEAQSKNFRFYVKEYRTTKVALDEANLKVEDLTAQLEAANTELSATRNELTSIQALNDDLKEGIASLEHFKAKALSKGEALETMIVAFKKKNKQLDADLQVVRKELSSFQPDIANTAEGREKLRRFKAQMVMVKKNMHGLKEQALAMKIAAQQQHDRLEILYGNNGYLVKNGKNQSLKRQGAKVDIKVEFK